MTLKDLFNTLYGTTEVSITALAYFKDTKKYYSFRTVTYNETVSNCMAKLSEDELNSKISHISVVENVLRIDIIEFI